MGLERQRRQTRIEREWLTQDAERERISTSRLGGICAVGIVSYAKYGDGKSSSRWIIYTIEPNHLE